MKILKFIIFVVILFVAGCASLHSAIQGRHNYELLFFDVGGNPLEGVKVEYEIKENGEVIKSAFYITPPEGNLYESVDIHGFQKTEFNYKASKDGYPSKSGRLEANGQYPPTKVEKITLINPTDYFNKEFLSSLSDAKLKTKILRFIDLIILQGILSDSALEAHSVNLVPFKGDSYLHFKFTNMNVYNSLKLDKYDIGKLMFDEVIRKILTPLNEHVAESNLFYGYDLMVVSHTKSFIDKYATAKTVEYRFMIPEKIVRQYKNKDISGQQVLDASIILMDDERIELKLQ